MTTAPPPDALDREAFQRYAVDQLHSAADHLMRARRALEAIGCPNAAQALTDYAVDLSDYVEDMRYPHGRTAVTLYDDNGAKLDTGRPA